MSVCASLVELHEVNYTEAVVHLAHTNTANKHLLICVISVITFCCVHLSGWLKKRWAFTEASLLRID